MDRTITLALRLTDEEKKETYGIIENSMDVTDAKEEQDEEKTSQPISELVQGIIQKAEKNCEQQGLRILNRESLNDELPIAILLCVVKEDTSEISIDVPVEELKVEKDETSEEEEQE